EASLWLSWEHHGTMTCADHTSYLFQLDGANFRKIMVRSDQAELCAMYARLFHKGLMEAYITEEEASDLFGSDEDVAQIMTPIRAVIRTSNLMADFGHFSAVWAFQVWKEWLQEQKDERRRSKRNNFNFCGRREVS
ncbi:Potassium channel AKT2, partial [Durusdinium trenchii]